MTTISSSPASPPLSLATLPTVLVFHIMSILQPDDIEWMMFYARMCLVSKSLSSTIVAKVMATADDLHVPGTTDRMQKFAAVAILLRHCGAPSLRSLNLLYNDCFEYSACSSGIYLQAILDQLAAGQAPNVLLLEFERIVFDGACLVAFKNAIADGHLVNLYNLYWSHCTFAHGAAEMLMESFREYSAQLPRLKSVQWNFIGSDDTLSFAQGLQYGACPVLEELYLGSCRINEQTMNALCEALTIGGESVTSCARTLKTLVLFRLGGGSAAVHISVWTRTRTSLRNWNACTWN